jgi:glycine hydroxymethyltransferase
MNNLDPVIYQALRNETSRQRDTIELIASENFTSYAVMELCGSVFTNKYAEGLIGKRYYNGCEFIDEVEDRAIELVTNLYGTAYANVQPHSGANANLAVFKAFLKPGDTILGMDLSNGGHLSHGSKVNVSGAWFDAQFYGLDEFGYIDYGEVYKKALEFKPKMIIAGASSYSRIIDWAEFRKIADLVGAILLVDMSHYSGLIAGGSYPNPGQHAHVITSTTHKTLRGPRGGIILWNDESFSKKINSAVFPGTQGGPLMHIIAAKAQCFYEALDTDFIQYTKDVILNAQVMAKRFIDLGVPVVSGGTNCHMFTIDLSNEKMSGREYADHLEKNGITVNKNSIPNDPRSFVETSGIRIGTAAETTRGRDSEFFQSLATKMVKILRE